MQSQSHAVMTSDDEGVEQWPMMAILRAPCTTVKYIAKSKGRSEPRPEQITAGALALWHRLAQKAQDTSVKSGHITTRKKQEAVRAAYIGQ
jgi:hypothetical protein